MQKAISGVELRTKREAIPQPSFRRLNINAKFSRLRKDRKDTEIERGTAGQRTES